MHQCLSIHREELIQRCKVKVAKRPRRAATAEQSSRHGGTFVNLFRERADDAFVQQPALTARDSLHPSDAGYQVWFGELMAQADLPQQLSAALAQRRRVPPQ